MAVKGVARFYGKRKRHVLGLEQRLERSYGHRIVRVRYEMTLQLSNGAVRAPSFGQGFRK